MVFGSSTLGQPQSTYICKVQISVWRRPNIDSPPPLHPASMSSPRTKGGGRTYSPGGEGVGGSIFWKTPDIGLASYSLIPLRGQPYLLIPSQLNQSGNCHHNHASYISNLCENLPPLSSLL
jgi:hypothetical protein